MDNSGNSTQSKAKSRPKKKNGFRTFCSIIISMFVLFVLYEIILYIPLSRMAHTVAPKNDSVDNMVITMVDVGQGDGFVIRQGDKVIVIDTGTIVKSKNVNDYLKSQNINKIDVLILTHPHQDHAGGLMKILRSVYVEELYTPDVSIKTRANPFDQTCMLIYENWIFLANKAYNNQLIKPFIDPTTGELETIHVGEMEIQFLTPTRPYLDRINNNSLAFKLTYKDFSCLFTGDIEEEAEADLMNSGVDLDVTLLKAPHHGSKTSSWEKFLEKTNPELTFISCGKDNFFGFPGIGYVSFFKERNIPMFRTDESGTITLITDGYTYQTDKAPGDYLTGSELKATKSKE